ncbi:MAG: hypothetical protein QW750_00205 [Zestosphaera sp.]
MIKINIKRKIIILLAIATLISIVNASVFVYYPVTLKISPQQPPVVFREGTNAGQPDLWGKTITVNIGNEGTSLEITVHPTLQRNYYYNLTEIVSQDSSNTYYIKFRVTRVINDVRVNTAYLIINSTDYQYQIDLKTTGLQPNNWISLQTGGKLRVDLYLELSGYSGDDISASVDLIITTTQTTETPPEPLSS